MTPDRFAGLRTATHEMHRIDALRTEQDALAVVQGALCVRTAREPGGFVLALLVLAELDRHGFDVRRRAP